MRILGVAVALSALCVLASSQNPQGGNNGPQPPPPRPVCKIVYNDGTEDSQECPGDGECTLGPADVFSFDISEWVKVSYCAKPEAPPAPAKGPKVAFCNACRIRKGEDSMPGPRGCDDGETCSGGPLAVINEDDRLIVASFCVADDEEIDLLASLDCPAPPPPPEEEGETNDDGEEEEEEEEERETNDDGEEEEERGGDIPNTPPPLKRKKNWHKKNWHKRGGNRPPTPPPLKHKKKHWHKRAAERPPTPPPLKHKKNLQKKDGERPPTPPPLPALESQLLKKLMMNARKA